ncbi:MAG: UDP-4-amino-4,6-dideoxy-N-acetyl-beta-L-altrosamine N-acetyltransferase [Candidatus Zixiibacteriota bacterium]
MHDRYRLRPIVESDLEMVRNWRNRDRIRKYMYTDHVISPAEHAEWFERLQSDESRETCVMEYCDRPAGIVNYTRIDRATKKCLWGFYLAEPNLPRGSGTMLGYQSLEYAFGPLSMRTVTGEVLDFNEPSQRLFERLGFSRDGLRKEPVIKDERIVEVHLYSMERTDWHGGHRGAVELLVTNRCAVRSK